MLYIGGSFGQASAFIDLLDELVAEGDAEPGPGLHMHIVCEQIIGLVSSGFHLRFLQVTPVSSVMRVEVHAQVVLGGSDFVFFRLIEQYVVHMAMSCQHQTV